MRKLFGVAPRVYTLKESNAVNITLSRRSLVEFCKKILGLPIGDKIQQQIDIPRWVQENKQYLERCIRGLIDTDGSLYMEQHNHNPRYAYPRLDFTSASADLIKSVHTALLTYGLAPSVRRSGRSVRIEKREKIWEYFHTIGSSNEKHLAKVRLLTETRRNGGVV